MSDEHVLELRATGWGLEHPDACHEGGRSLLDCPIHDATMAWAGGLDGQPEELGRFVVTADDEGLIFGGPVQ